MRTFLCLLLAALWAQAADPRLNAILWHQSSVEYSASARQAFKAATVMLDRALKDKKWTAALEQKDKFDKLPPAVICDADETLIDNWPAQARFVQANRGFDRELWDAWTKEAAAQAIPGAVEFAKYAQSRGVTVFYVTNRNAGQEPATLQNLKTLGFPIVEKTLGDLGDSLMTFGERPEWQGDKTTRRAAIAKNYRILLLVGDDLNDFITGARTTPEARRKLVEPYASYWGEKWIMVPNAQYGSWEDSLYGFDRSLPAEEIEKRKLERLLPPKAAGAATN